MNSFLYVPDDGAFFTLLELGQVEGYDIPTITEALNEFIDNGALRFPKEVVSAVVNKHNPETEQTLCVWIKTASRMFECTIEWRYKLDAQAWAQDNGYPNGLDSALGGRESCVVPITAYILKLLDLRRDCQIVTDDNRSVPGRVPLAEVCQRLGVPVIGPAEFLRSELKCIIE